MRHMQKHGSISSLTEEDDFEEDDFEDELPEIPLYSNDYHDFFTSKLHDFEEDGYNWDATNAILYANME